MHTPASQKIVSTTEPTSSGEDLVYIGVDNEQNRHIKYPFKPDRLPTSIFSIDHTSNTAGI